MKNAENTFLELYEQHYDEVHNFCSRRVGRVAADDAAAEVFMVAWRRIEDAPEGLAHAWLYGIGRNVIRNQWRTTYRRARLLNRIRGHHVEPPQPDVVVVRNETDSLVQEALLGLRWADREILMLSAWDDLTGPEIARVLGISLNAVQQRLHRAKKRLAARIAHDYPALANTLGGGRQG